MSRAEGNVLKDGEVVAFFIYNGTVDIACSALSGSREEAWEDWSKGDLDRHCTCRQPAEAVTLRSFYGGGHDWPAKVCLNCMVITEGANPYPEDEAWP